MVVVAVMVSAGSVIHAEGLETLNPKGPGGEERGIRQLTRMGDSGDRPWAVGKPFRSNADLS